MGNLESIGEQIRSSAVALGRAIVIMLMWLVLLLLALLRGLVNLLAQMFHFLSRTCSIIAKVMIIALIVAATLNAAAATWRAYGRDLPALIPAALLIVTMLALGIEGGNWGALFTGGIVALAIGVTIEALDLTTRSLVVVGALAVAIAQTQFNRYKEIDSHEYEAQEKLECVYPDNQDRLDLLHDAPNGRSSDVHPASQH